ncbi:MAG: cache domain-containing protein [Desulfuromonadaceae bacterium]|nr:cache domain-containing protein [Desulfuromonadaceae bacterium]
MSIFPAFLNDLKLRWKLMVVVLPLVMVPLVVVGVIVGYSSSDLARQSINQVSRGDLQHMAVFTRHLLESHYQQFQVYQQERKNDFEKELKNLLRIAEDMVMEEQRLVEKGEISPVVAKQRARKLLNSISIGESGYVYTLTSAGQLQVHVAREGENIFDQQDGDGRFFIREMCQTALSSEPGSIHQIRYPWRNKALGDTRYREKLALYLYVPQWDWIIAAAGYIEESYSDLMFERKAFEELKEKIKQKRVGQTGYIFCMDSHGTFTVHPEGEGQNFIDVRDSNGNAFIREMCEQKHGWIRYPWHNAGEPEARYKIVRYEYFEPWDWIVAVGCYEDEFYQAANSISWNTAKITLFVTLIACLFSMLLVGWAAKILTDPIQHMMTIIHRIKAGHLNARMQLDSRDELGELARTFNRMTQMIQKNKEMEASLAQQGKMASLGVLSSGVAHEINNPLGVILGYAAYLEGKIGEDDPNYQFIHEIKRESKRCKKIVQDLLSYARTPKSVMTETDLNVLLQQIVDFAANHTDMHHVDIHTDFEADLPSVELDGDQIRQVAINLILNAGGAIQGSGRLDVETRREGSDVLIHFRDNGCGMDAQTLEKIFEPFYTTKEKGTGLGMAISRQIVEQHQGRIQIDSTLGEGTTVTVRLPLQREKD